MDKKPLNRFERRKLRTKKKLNEAVIELILERGYEPVSIQDITDRADLARATFYLHYKDKDEILWDFINEGLDDFHHKVHALRDSYHGDKPFIYYAFLLDFQLLDQNRNLYKIVFGNVGPEPIRRRAKELMVADIEQHIRDGQIFQTLDLPPTFVAQFVTGALHQLFQWRLEEPNQYTPEQMIEMVYQMLSGVG